MNENREYFLQVLRYYMTEIAEAYKDAYPDANFLNMCFFVGNGTITVNNEYYGVDSDFPISECFGSGKWYDYRKGANEQ